jgi:hypothetical protein
MFRTCLPAGRYKENKKILLIRHTSGGLIPGPDLAFQGRSTWPHPEYFMTTQIDCTEVAPPDPVPVSGRGGRACSSCRKTFRRRRLSSGFPMVFEDTSRGDYV